MGNQGSVKGHTGYRTLSNSGFKDCGHAKSQAKHCCQKNMRSLKILEKKTILLGIVFDLLGVAAVDLVWQDGRVGGKHRRRHRLRVQGPRLVARGPPGLRQ